MAGRSTRQMSFDLPVQVAMTREDYIVDEANSPAFELITSWPKWPSNIVILAGPIGSGKTHLASIFAEQASAIWLKLDALPEPGRLEELSDCAIVLDNISDLSGLDASVFHLLNHVLANNSHMLIVSRTWPESWNVSVALSASGHQHSAS